MEKTYSAMRAARYAVAQPAGARNDSGENKDRSEARDDEKQQTDQIVDTGSVITGDGRHMIHCLTVIGQIEGHNVLPSQNKTTKYEHVIPQLVAIEEEPRIDGLLMILNTVGGDVEAGLAIAELVAGMKKPTVSLVLGGGIPLGCRWLWRPSIRLLRRARR